MQLKKTLFPFNRNIDLLMHWLLLKAVQGRFSNKQHKNFSYCLPSFGGDDYHLPAVRRPANLLSIVTLFVSHVTKLPSGFKFLMLGF